MAKDSLTRGRLESLAMTKVLAANPKMLGVRPQASLFMADYMSKFPVRRFGKNLILHSHLPPLTSKAYSRFVSHHLVKKAPGPSHAQIGVTNACPQNCGYCYNKGRGGVPLDTPNILRAIDGLREAGVAWLGLTGGEPLKKRDLADIVAYASPDMAVKLFTSGVGLTAERAQELADAGVFSVAVSLDHWEAARHDASRGYPGAFAAALEAIEMFKQVPGLHVSVSSVLSREAIRDGGTERLVSFLDSLDIDEAWLSEVKPTGSALWSADQVITDEERHQLMRMQDERNRLLRARARVDGDGDVRMTINYLGHFEGCENFGCNAGCKMVYVDAFGEVSPCVFLPMSFGNVRERPLAEILTEMRRCFPGEDRCFINRNYRLLSQVAGYSGSLPLDRESTLALVHNVRFGPPSEFGRRLYGERIAS